MIFQVIKEKLFHINVYPCCLKAGNKWKLKSKVVFIVFIYATMTLLLNDLKMSI